MTFDAVAARWRNYVAYVNKHGVPWHDAEIVTATVLYRVWRAMDRGTATFDTDIAQRVYVATALKREIAVWMRRPDRTMPIDLIPPSDAPRIMYELPDVDELSPDLASAIRRLTPDQRRALYAAASGYYPREMAAAWGRDTGYWYNQLMFMRRRLRPMLAHRVGEVAP
jgi:DNA-directed RNA polymerase specialized sigma24 family protein